MEQIKEIIHSVITELTSNKKRPQEEILRVWQEALGKKAIKHTKIIGKDKGKLFVNVDSSVWLFQLNLNRNYLLKKLRQVASDLEEINFRIGRIQ